MSQINWELAAHQTTVIAAVASMVTALIALITIIITKNQAKRQRKIDMMPVLALSEGKALSKQWLPGSKVNAESHIKLERYPINLFFKNLGKGPANLVVVDLDNHEIECHIGTPTTVGPGSNAEVKLFLRDELKGLSVKLALYYRDIENNVYSTQVKLRLSYYTTDDLNFNVPTLQWTMDAEKVFPISNSLPNEISHWPRKNYFYKFII